MQLRVNYPFMLSEFSGIDLIFISFDILECELNDLISIVTIYKYRI